MNFVLMHSSKRWSVQPPAQRPQQLQEVRATQSSAETPDIRFIFCSGSRRNTEEATLTCVNQNMTD